MNQRTFFRLLNLYIDGEIAPADASRLEEEILRNPKRRRVYDEYCRIHRATKLVYDRFREAAAAQGISGLPALQDAATASPVSLQRPVSRRLGPFAWTAAASAMLAAVLLAVVATRTSELGQPGAMTVDGGTAASGSVAAAATESAFAAPFAAETRVDPYLPQMPVARSTGLSMVSWPNGESEWRIESSLLDPARGFSPALFGPIDAGLPDSIVRPEAQSPRVFRSAHGRAPVQLEPVGFRIHR